MQRLVPPGGSDPATITVNGRYYSCPAGSGITVPDQDAFVMLANGWALAAGPLAAGADTSANRPANPVAAQGFYDTTLGKGIVWNGANWIDPDTGAAV